MADESTSPTNSGTQKYKTTKWNNHKRCHVKHIYSVVKLQMWKSGTDSILDERMLLPDAVDAIRTMDRARSECQCPRWAAQGRSTSRFGFELELGLGLESELGLGLVQFSFSDKSTRCGGLEEAQALPRDALLINYVNSSPSTTVSTLLLLLHRNTWIYREAPHKFLITCRRRRYNQWTIWRWFKVF